MLINFFILSGSCHFKRLMTLGKNCVTLEQPSVCVAFIYLLVLITGTWCSSTSAGWGFGSTGKKWKLSPVQRIPFLCMELDSVDMTVCLTNEPTQSVLNLQSSFRGRTVVSLKQFQKLLGHMASTAAVMPFKLLHMRPLQHWSHNQSRDGHCTMAHIAWQSRRCAAAHSAPGRT